MSDTLQYRANKFLYHSFVESPDMMNIYNGNITTNEKGAGVVSLPDYFEAGSTDFRYQLTVIDKDARAFIKEEIAMNEFVIQSSAAYTKVNWQVTGIRKDKWANEHRAVDVVEKTAAEKGYYLHPEIKKAPAGRILKLKRD